MLKRYVPACAVALGLALPASATVDSPYYNDFSSDVNDFVEQRDIDWTHDEVQEYYTYYRSDGSHAWASALVDVLGMGVSGVDFTIETRMIVRNVRGTFGVTVMNSSDTLGGSYYYAAGDYYNGGYTVRLSEWGGDQNAYVNVSGGHLGGVRDLTLEGTWLENGSLRLDLTWEKSGDTPRTLSITDSTPSTGSHAGLYVEKEFCLTCTLTAEVDYVDFSVTTVPTACIDGLDNDGDGSTDYPGDPGCESPSDDSERDDTGTYPCDDGEDNEDLPDGFVDFRADGSGDPGCKGPEWFTEEPACQDGIDNDGEDGIDNDGELGTDFDGGESVLGVGSGNPDGPDPNCFVSWKRTEAPSTGPCGLGAELALLLPPLMWLSWRRRRSLE